MRPSRVLQKLRNNQPAVLTTLHLTDPSLYELTSLMGFDGIWMDLEHHAYSVETAGQLMRAARVGVSDILARPAKGEFMRMGRMLEAGAQGIMYPRCENADEAREVVRWSKFAPLGTRGFDGGNPDMPYCTMPMPEYLKRANEETFVVIQIESPEALEHVEEMSTVEGVDVIFLGPADFSILSGIPGQFGDMQIQTAIDRIASATKNAGKHWGMPCFSTDHTKEIMEKGARFLAYGADIIFVMRGLQKMQDDLTQLGCTFDNQLGK